MSFLTKKKSHCGIKNKVVIKKLQYVYWRVNWTVSVSELWKIVWNENFHKFYNLEVLRYSVY